jgi:hypothetical protein
MGYPISVSRTDNVTGPGAPADITAASTAQLYENGTLVVNTHASEWTDLHGGHVGVVVLFYNTATEWIFTSEAVRYGLDGKWIGTSTITTSFTQTVDPNTIANTDYVVIKHYNAPNDAYHDIQAWLNGAVTSFGSVAQIATDIRGMK